MSGAGINMRYYAGASLKEAAEALNKDKILSCLKLEEEIEGYEQYRCVTPFEPVLLSKEEKKISTSGNEPDAK